jgi:hypothetical protein
MNEALLTLGLLLNTARALKLKYWIQAIWTMYDQEVRNVLQS